MGVYLRPLSGAPGFNREASGGVVDSPDVHSLRRAESTVGNPDASSSDPHRETLAAAISSGRVPGNSGDAAMQL